MSDSTDNNFIKFQRNFFKDRSVSYENTNDYFVDNINNNNSDQININIRKETEEDAEETDDDEDRGNLSSLNSSNLTINSIPEKLTKLSKKFKRKDSVTSLFSRKPSICFNSSDSSVSTLTFNSIGSINSSNHPQMKETNSWSNNNQSFSPNPNNISYNNNNNNFNNNNSNLLKPRNLRANSSPQTSISRKTSLSLKNLANNNNNPNPEVFEKLEQPQLVERSNSISNDISDEYLSRNNRHLSNFRSPSTINSGKFEKFPDYDDSYSISSLDEHLKLQLLNNQEESSISGWSLQNGLFVSNNDHTHLHAQYNGNGTDNSDMNAVQRNMHQGEDELSDLIAQDVLNRLGQ